ncbi:MAG: hypothetical protein CR960_00310 [Pasteurellales bacterium]|nr:MAG: hypothetical protein CR960_00310 [Pasteurellales bacterium]
MIKLNQVSKEFKIENDTFTYPLSNVSLEFKEGSVNYLVGESGAGKSSLLKLITGDFYPTKGEVFINGKLFNAKNRFEVQALRKHIGVVYQNLPLIADLTAIENVMQPLLAQGVSLERASLMAKAMLEKVGLFDQENGFHQMLPRYLSSGQQQRVSIACAMVTNPSILIADEPTANVDDDTARQIFQLFFDYVEKNQTTIPRTVIIATHSYLINEFKSRTYRLSKGFLTVTNNN